MEEAKRQKLNDIFRNHMEKNGDIRPFLHLPPDTITPEIRFELDKFLANEAYEHLDESKDYVQEDLVVYREGSTFIYFDSYEKKKAYLEHLLRFFTEIEAYEKCTKVSNILNKINDGKGS